MADSSYKDKVIRDIEIAEYEAIEALEGIGLTPDDVSDCVVSVSATEILGTAGGFQALDLPDGESIVSTPIKDLPDDKLLASVAGAILADCRYARYGCHPARGGNVTPEIPARLLDAQEWKTDASLLAQFSKSIEEKLNLLRLPTLRREHLSKHQSSAAKGKWWTDILYNAAQKLKTSGQPKRDAFDSILENGVSAQNVDNASEESKIMLYHSDRGLSKSVNIETFSRNYWRTKQTRNR